MKLLYTCHPGNVGDVGLVALYKIAPNLPKHLTQATFEKPYATVINNTKVVRILDLLEVVYFAKGYFYQLYLVFDEKKFLWHRFTS